MKSYDQNLEIYTRSVQKNPQENPQDVIYTGAPEIAVRLKVNPKTVFRNRHQIPHKMLGNQMVTSEAVLAEWLAGRLVWPPESIEKTTNKNKNKNKGGRPKNSELVMRLELAQGQGGAK